MILNVYKEKNWTSFDVVAKIRGILRYKRGIKNVKVGHAGTLDPLAEGVLIVLTDLDTKRQDQLMLSEKEYICEIEFGKESDTYDLEGEIIKVPLPDNFDLKTQVTKIIPQYIGEIQQKVPPYSAVKVAGKPLYKSARKGTLDENTIPTKIVNIFDIELLKTEKNTAKLRVHCSKGTYIRSLAHDLGTALSTGAVLTSLIRTRVGDFKVENSIRINDLEL